MTVPEIVVPPLSLVACALNELPAIVYVNW